MIHTKPKDVPDMTLKNIKVYKEHHVKLAEMIAPYKEEVMKLIEEKEKNIWENSPAFKMVD